MPRRGVELKLRISFDIRVNFFILLVYFGKVGDLMNKFEAYK